MSSIKKSGTLSRFWMDPHDLTNSPSVSFRIKARQPTSIRIWLKQVKGRRADTAVVGVVRKLVGQLTNNRRQLDNRFFEIPSDSFVISDISSTASGFHARRLLVIRRYVPFTQHQQRRVRRFSKKRVFMKFFGPRYRFLILPV